MAQILKFQGGGSTPTSSWGTFTIDNVTYNMDDANIKRLYDHARKLDPDVAYQFDFIINALKSGKNLSYSNNKLYGGVDFDITDRQAKKIKEKPARGFGTGRDARLAISSLDNLSLSNPTPETKNIKLHKRFAEYERDNEGNFILEGNSKKWIKGANNQEILDLLDQIEAYSLSPEEFTISGIEGKDAKWLRSFYNSYGKDDWANLKKSISEGSWDQATIEALNDINLFLDRQPTDAELSKKTKREATEEEARIAKEESAIYGSRKFNKDQSHLIAYDKTSNSFKIVDPNAAQFISNLGNVWLNDEFAQAYPTYASLLEGHDNGLFVVNGKLYDAEDDALLEIPLVKQWIDENKRKVGGSDLIKWNWKTNPEDNWITDTWNNVPIHNTYGLTNYRDLTGLYDNLGTYNSSPISNIFQLYPDQITPEMYDEFGFFKPEYYNYVAYSNGNIIDDLEPESFNEYLKSLKLASDSKKEQYYSNLPSYLKPTIKSKNGDILVQESSNVFYHPKSGIYITSVKLKNGKTRYVILNDKYSPNTPLENIWDFITDQSADLTAFNLSDEYGIAIKKKGGKIHKANNGYKIPYKHDSEIYTRPFFEYDDSPEVLKLKLKLAEIPDNIQMWSANHIPKTLPKVDLMAELNKSVYSRRENDRYGTTENNFDLNIKGSDLIGLGRFISDIASANKIYNNNIEAFNDLKTHIYPNNVTYKRPIWHFNSGKYQQAKQQLLNTPGIRTSDPTAMYAYAKDKLGKLVDLDLAHNVEMSDSYNKHMNELLAIDNKETQERVAGLNEFKSKLAQIRQMELNALNQRDLTIAQNIENKGLELQSKMYQDEQMRNSIANEQLQLDYNQAYLKAVQDKFEQLGGFANFTDGDYKLYGRDILSYMSDKYPYELANIKSNQGLKYKIDAYNNNRMWYSPRMKYAKKGTKLSTFDKLFLSQNKATQRAVENLNKDIVRIFLQMMK